MQEFCIILITAGSVEEGERIAGSLVDNHLVACVNVVPSVNLSSSGRERQISRLRFC